MTARPLVVAHRGASIDEPEHTLAAYRRAIDEGADALECDVRLTADGHLVLVHDRRIDRTSNGRGAVSSRTLSELAQHDYGALVTTDDELVVEDEERKSVLTLRALLNLARRHDVGLSIETKHPTRYAGYVEQAVVEALRAAGYQDGDPRIRIMSFSELALRRMRRLAPSIPTVFLMERVPMRFRDGSLPHGAVAAGPSIEVLRRHPSYVERVHASGAHVHVWTVDGDEDVELCRSLGVDAIITNRPGHVRSLLR